MRRRSAAALCALVGGIAATIVSTANALAEHPYLFMTLDDVSDTWGRISERANSVQPVEAMQPPALNYTAGATAFGAFSVLGDPNTFEVYVMVGRPGEPLLSAVDQPHVYDEPMTDDQAPQGVSILRFTTTDFVTWSDPITVLYLPNGSGSASGANDGSIWTAKSVDRNPATGEYMLMASYGSGVHSFTSTDVTKANSFAPTTGALNSKNFEDHDDCNIIYHPDSGEWVDMQIMFQTISSLGLKNYTSKKYCDNVGNNTRRVVSVRTSATGLNWTQDAGCADQPQKGEHCQTFNTSGMVAPRVGIDPPELEYYRIRPTFLGQSGRLVAHVLLYVPSPPEVVMEPGYGRQPLWYCKSGCCHGPHIYESWWIGPQSGDPRQMTEWKRPYYDTPAAPHDIWLMAQPVTYKNMSHVWVDNGRVWSLPLYRVAGLYTASNGEFNTDTFDMPKVPLWINAEAVWPGGNHVGGADEGHAAYIMAEVHDATTGAVVPGYERTNFNVLMNVDDIRLPLTWKSSNTTVDGVHAEMPWPPVGAPEGSKVYLRIYFRAATIYAIGNANQ